MKSLSEQMQGYDRENFRRVAHGMPEVHEQATLVDQTAGIFNELFNQLRAAFPAAMAGFREQGHFNELRRQWALAFRMGMLKPPMRDLRAMIARGLTKLLCM